MNKPRALKANEIELRAQSVKTKGAVMLLFKDARVDMNILDEIYGIDGWQRTHEVINGNLFCNIDLWDDKKKMWIRKQDVGIESNQQKEKGEASDAFKRAGFNVGIGRELYTKIFIWINLDANETQPKQNDKTKLQLSFKTKFHVSDIESKDGTIIHLEIKDANNKTRFTYDASKYKASDTKAPKGEPDAPKAEIKIDTVKAKTLMDKIELKGVDVAKLMGYFKVNSLNELTVPQFTLAMKKLDN